MNKSLKQNVEFVFRRKEKFDNFHAVHHQCILDVKLVKSRRTARHRAQKLLLNNHDIIVINIDILVQIIEVFIQSVIGTVALESHHGICQNNLLFLFRIFAIVNIRQGFL